MQEVTSKKCLRCKREFISPVPEMTNPSGDSEIACVDWCAGCNALVMTVVLRERSAYRMKKLVDPKKGGKNAYS